MKLKHKLHYITNKGIVFKLVNEMTWWRHLYFRRLVAGLSPRQRVSNPRSVRESFVVDKWLLREVFYEYFILPCQVSLYQILHSFHPLHGVRIIDL